MFCLFEKVSKIKSSEVKIKELTEDQNQSQKTKLNLQVSLI